MKSCITLVHKWLNVKLRPKYMIFRPQLACIDTGPCREIYCTLADTSLEWSGQ